MRAYTSIVFICTVVYGVAIGYFPEIAYWYPIPLLVGYAAYWVIVLRCSDAVVYTRSSGAQTRDSFFAIAMPVFALLCMHAVFGWYAPGIAILLAGVASVLIYAIMRLVRDAQLIVAIVKIAAVTGVYIGALAIADIFDRSALTLTLYDIVGLYTSIFVGIGFGFVIYRMYART